MSTAVFIEQTVLAIIAIDIRVESHCCSPYAEVIFTLLIMSVVY